MIPSASSTGDLSWHAAATADTWADHPAAAAAVGGAYSSTANVATDSRYLNLHRHQILDWENAMLLAHHHEPVYDQVQDDYSKSSSMPSMHAEAIPSLSHPRHYENLLSAHMHASASTSLSSNNAWGLLNTVCSRNSGGQLQAHQESTSTFLQTASTPYTYDNCLTHEGAEGLVGYGSLPGTGGFYADPLRSNSSTGGNMIGLSSFDQRRLDDIVKRELYTTHDLNSRLGLNLGGRTYFSAADDFAFGRWGKRLRPNSPGCMMQPAPLCQAEGCKADLSMAKHYHRRHKVCEYHSKAATVHIGEQTQRFCQQCSRFHVLAEFDDGKRSCRKRLADHNRRRRKPQPAPTLAIEAAADAKDQSQEAPTRSESPQNGTQSSKGSPTQQVEDQQLMSTMLTASSPTGNANEASSKKGQLQVVLEQEKVEHGKAGASSSSSSQSKLKSDGSSAITLNSKSTTTSVPSELAGNSTPLAANLSLGAGSDIVDVKPTAASSALLSHKGSHFESGSTHAAHVMPWLQGSKKHSSLQGFPYDSTTKSDHNVEMVGGAAAGRVVYGERGSDSQSRSCWMMKGMTGEVSQQAEKDTLMAMSSRQGAKSSNPETAGAGGHELLRLLGDETRELLSSNKQSAAALQTNASTVGTLAFFEQSLEQQSPSGFLRDTEQRMIQFSSLHQPAAGEDVDEQGQQGTRSHLPIAASKFSFGNHNHFI